MCVSLAKDLLFSADFNKSGTFHKNDEVVRHGTRSAGPESEVGRRPLLIPERMGVPKVITVILFCLGGEEEGQVERLTSRGEEE